MLTSHHSVRRVYQQCFSVGSDSEHPRRKHGSTGFVHGFMFFGSVLTDDGLLRAELTSCFTTASNKYRLQLLVISWTLSSFQYTISPHEEAGVQVNSSEHSL